MTGVTSVPVSILLEGPLFMDELETQPQHFRRNHDIDSLRLVPSKSAASGVHTIYFKPEHRQWALVRLVTRYRGLFEIQLHRGMSGEYQLLGQGFTSEDLEFLLDIMPRPPADYSTIVYDMLWLVATYDEYLVLAREMCERESFVPEELVRSTTGVDIDDLGFFTRFLRSYLIRPEMNTTTSVNHRSNLKATDASIDGQATYVVTDDGSKALEGILAEHERIFEQRSFEPLLINPDLDPLKHIKEYGSKVTQSEPSVSLEELQDESGVLGEIAESFAPLEEEFEDPEGPSSSPKVVDAETDPQTTHGSQDGGAQKSSSATTVTGQESVETGQRPGGSTTDGGRLRANHRHDSYETNRPSDESNQGPDDADFTRDEIVHAAAAAARLITEESVVRTTEVKSVAWESVDLAGRSRGLLWTSVRDVLVAMESIHGGEEGRIWASSEWNAEN